MRRFSKYRAINNLVILLFVFTACKKREHIPAIPAPPGNEEELITTFKLELTDSVSGKKMVYYFVDPDGDGGEPAYYGPDQKTQTDSLIILKKNTVYAAEVVLMDESREPASLISEEVKKEGQDHMLFYSNGNNSGVSSDPMVVKLSDGTLIRYMDSDEGQPKRPIGIKTRWQTSSAGVSGLPLLIELRHQPGVKDGSYSPGETDIMVRFALSVK